MTLALPPQLSSPLPHADGADKDSLKPRRQPRRSRVQHLATLGDASAGGQVHSSPLAHLGGGALPVGTQKALGHEGRTAASVAVA